MNIAIVGFAENTRELHKNSDVDEVWSLNRCWELDWNVDRIFEMHGLDYIRDPNNQDTKASLAKGKTTHWEWLQNNHNIPIITLERFSEIPCCVPYPLNDVIANVYGNVYRGAERMRLFASTFDYMIALAIYEKANRIEIYGFEMMTGTEYQYQQNSGNLLMGIAAGRGIDVVISEKSVLIPRMKLYGYEGAQMISRQTLEAYKRINEDERERWKAITNAYLGQLQLPPVNEKIDEIQGKFQQARSMVDKYDGALQTIEMLIAECDMLEVDPRLEEKMIITNAFKEANNGNNS